MDLIKLFWYLIPVEQQYQYKHGLHREHDWKLLWRRLFHLFSDNLALVLDLLTLKDKHNKHTLSVNIKLYCTLCETGQKSSLFYLFLKLVQINFNIFRQCTYIVYFLCYPTKKSRECVIVVFFSSTTDRFSRKRMGIKLVIFYRLFFMIEFHELIWWIT